MSLTGPHLIGFSDFFANEALGAAVAKGKATPGGKKPPKGGKTGQIKKPYPKPGRTQALEHHGKVLHGAHAVVTKAAHVLARAQQLLTAKPAPVVTAHPSIRPVFHANKPVHLGAAAAALSSRQKLAVQKHNDAVAKQQKATKNLVQQAAKAHKSASTLAKHMIHQRKVAKGLRTPKRQIHVGAMLADPMIGAHFAEALQEYYEQVGAAPDPTNPGYLDDGSPDPAAQSVTVPTSGAAPTDSSAADASMFDDGSLTAPETDPATLPPAPPMDTFIPDMAAAGGIAYDGSKGTPDGYVLSYGLATRKTDIDLEPDTAQIEGNAHFGYVWGKYDKKDPANGGVGWGSHLAPNAWNHIHGRFYLGDDSWYNTVDGSEAFASAKKTADANLPGVHSGGAAGWKFSDIKQNSYGPLVGNPVLKDFAAMRVDAQGNMFWLPQEAPDWLTFPIKQAAAITAQAAKKAAADAAAADAAAQAKAQADAAAAQSAQDAQNALSESQSASQQKIAQGEAETQAQQAMVQQQQAETAQQAMETEQEKQAGQLLIQQAQQDQAQDQQVQAMLLQQAQREQEYFAQHPEEEFAPQAADGGDEDMEEERGTDDGGGFDEPTDDGGTSGDADWGDDRGAEG